MGVKHGKMLTVRKGFLICPTCRTSRRLMRIPPNAYGRGLAVYCRKCRTEHIVDIEKGQCFLSQS